MSDLDRRVLGLLELLHACPGNPSAWLRFLEALRDEISPDVITLFAAQPHATRPGILAGCGMGVTQVQLGDFLRPSTTHPTRAALPAGAVVPLKPDNPFKNSPLFREVLEASGVLAGPGFIVVNERTDRLVIATTLVLPRSKRWKPRARDLALLKKLAPHMVIARSTHNRLAERSRHAEALVSAFDRLVLGVVLVDENERVSYANRSAADLLGVEPGFTPPEVLAADIADTRTRAWRRLLTSDAGQGRNALFFAHPEDGRPLQVLATRFKWRDHEGSAAARFGRAVFIGDPRARTGDPAGVLRELYGLTRSETRLALLLLADHSVEEAADALGITLGTARGVLKTVFSKTRTNRQASLVRLLVSGPTGQLRSEAQGWDADASEAFALAASGVGDGRTG